MKIVSPWSATRTAVIASFHRHRSFVLAGAGTAAIAAAILMDLWSGQPLTVGWTQLFLLVLGAACLVASPPAVHRLLSTVVEQSHRESSSALVALQQHPVRLVGYGLWLAAAISFGELALRLYEHTTGKRVIGLQYLWSVPLTHALTLAAAGALVAVVSRWRNTKAALGFLLWTATFIALAGWLSMSIRGLHIVAAFTLAAGAGIQLARLVVPHLSLFDAVTRRTRIPLVGGILVVAVGSFLWPRVQEMRVTAGLPPAPHNAPNVLFIVLDTVRAASLGMYGYPRPTSPNLDRFAAGGVVFDHAISTAPWTLPSHGSMFTGRHPHELSGGWKSPIDSTHPTVAEALTKSGYQAAGFVANSTFCNIEFGLARGFAHYEDRRSTFWTGLQSTAFGGLLSRVKPSTEKLLHEDEKGRFPSAADINRQALAWLAERRTDRPFFVFLNYFDAHAPYRSPAEFGTRFSQTRPRGDIWSKALDDWKREEIDELRDAYDASIAYLDSQLGVLFGELERRGDLQNTVVIITSDHGEQFGEHGLLEHSNSLYTALLHVPLIVVYPPVVPAGARASERVSLRDLPATLTGLANVDGTAFPGKSLARAWQPGAAAARPGSVLLAETHRTHDVYPASYPARKGPMQSIVVDGFHYIRNLGDGRQELYDLAADPDELRDLAPNNAEMLKKYKEQLDKVVASNSPRGEKAPAGYARRN